MTPADQGIAAAQRDAAVPRDTHWPLISAAVHINNYGRGLAAPQPGLKNQVRVFRTSPDRVSMQIRGETRYATASIPFDLVPQIALALLEAAGVKTVDLWDADPPVHTDGARR